MTSSARLPITIPSEDRISTEEVLQSVRAVLAPLIRTPRLGITDFDQAIERLCELSARCLAVERASLWRFDAARGMLVCLNLYCVETNAHSKGTEIDMATTPRYLAALKGGGAIAAHDAQRDPRTSEFAAGYLVPLGISSMLDASVVVDGSLRGIACNEHVGNGPREWKADEVVAAMMFADLAAVLTASREMGSIDSQRRLSL